jgi:hypothetical protein
LNTASQLLVGAASYAPYVQTALQRGKPWWWVLITTRPKAGYYTMIALSFLAGIAHLVGFAGLAATLFELSSQTKVEGFRIAAALLALGLALSLASLRLLPNALIWAWLASSAVVLAGWIVVHDAAGRAVRVALAPSPTRGRPQPGNREARGAANPLHREAVRAALKAAA